MEQKLSVYLKQKLSRFLFQIDSISQEVVSSNLSIMGFVRKGYQVMLDSKQNSL